ncbi:uncharacterized protein A4U43_C04F1290 [Asparagus officinalis]|uniref:F-box domain-containing protein n=1 Tax=Asparagus officinalis TaxID=4686 RepID=A0A5P1EXD8_ASPOF|nr:F-box protein At3g07870-like [Asparagus officinalis]ONK70765.1 uncharacterized protein A4U43_C04F1290 [Asparagus officinalis]
MERIPEELLLEILSRTPTKSLLRSACVSKAWRDIMHKDHHLRSLHCDHLPSDNPTPLFFSNRRNENLSIIAISLAQDYVAGKPKIWHILKRQSFATWNNGTWNEDDYKLANTCNGLLCFRPNNYRQPIEICNPLCAEYSTLPAYPMQDIFSCSVGLGFSPSTKEYKVVVIAKDHGYNFSLPEEGSPGKLSIRTLGAEESWRDVGDIYFNTRHGPIYIDGKIHWTISYANSSTALHLLSFDLGTEEGKVIDNVPNNDGQLQLTQLKEGISVIVTSESDIKIWTLKEYHNIISWERTHIIELPRAPAGTPSRFPRLVGLWQRDDALQVWLHDVMILYDEAKNSEEGCKMYEEPAVSSTWRLHTSYVPSLVPLKRIGCESKKVFADQNHLIQHEELPPNCTPKRVVIELNL